MSEQASMTPEVTVRMATPPVTGPMMVKGMLVEVAFALTTTPSISTL